MFSHQIIPCFYLSVLLFFSCQYKHWVPILKVAKHRWTLRMPPMQPVPRHSWLICWDVETMSKTWLNNKPSPIEVHEWVYHIFSSFWGVLVAGDSADFTGPDGFTAWTNIYRFWLRKSVQISAVYSGWCTLSTSFDLWSVVMYWTISCPLGGSSHESWVSSPQL